MSDYTEQQVTVRVPKGWKMEEVVLAPSTNNLNTPENSCYAQLVRIDNKTWPLFVREPTYKARYATPT